MDTAQEELNRRYLAARIAWMMNPAIQEAARRIGLSHRQYCDTYVQHIFPPLAWAGDDLCQPDADAAYRAAAKEVDDA